MPQRVIARVVDTVDEGGAIFGQGVAHIGGFKGGAEDHLLRARLQMAAQAALDVAGGTGRI